MTVFWRHNTQFVVGLIGMVSLEFPPSPVLIMEGKVHVR